MGDAQDNFGNATELIKQGLLRAGAPRSSASIVAGGSAYIGNVRSEGERMIRERVAAAGLPLVQTGLLDNLDDNGRAVGHALLKASDERIAEQRPREASTEPAKTAEQYILEGLRAEQARTAAAKQARVDAAPKIRRSWK